MKPFKRIAQSRFLGLALFLISFATACAPTRSGVAWPNLTLVGDQKHILVSFNNFMVLIDPVTGQPVQLVNAEGQVRVDEQGRPRLWELSGEETDSQFFSSPLFLGDNTLLVADYNNRLLSVNYPTARLDDLVGVTLPGHVVAGIVMDADQVYVPLSERNLIALDLDTLQQAWIFPTQRGVWASPLLMDDVIYIPSMDHHLYAVDTGTGSLLWQLDLEGAIAATPLFVEDRFYVGTFARKVFEIGIDGGEPIVLATYETHDWVWSTPVLVDNVLYVTDLSGRVYALDTQNGLAELWQTRVAETGIRPSPLVVGDVIVVGARNGNAYWLDRETGQVIFEREIGSEILSELILIEPGDQVAVPAPLVIISTVSSSRVLVAFTLDDGVRRWVYER